MDVIKRHCVIMYSLLSKDVREEEAFEAKTLVMRDSL